MSVTAFLLSHRRAVAAIVAIATVLGVLAAAANAGGPNKFSSGTATVHVLVDVPDPPLLYRRLDLDAYASRGELLGRALASPIGLARVARHAGVPPAQLSGIARTVADVPRTLKEPGLEQRANEIVASRAP